MSRTRKGSCGPPSGKPAGRESTPTPQPARPLPFNGRPPPGHPRCQIDAREDNAEQCEAYTKEPHQRTVALQVRRHHHAKSADQGVEGREAARQVLVALLSGLCPAASFVSFWWLDADNPELSFASGFYVWFLSLILLIAAGVCKLIAVRKQPGNLEQV